MFQLEQAVTVNNHQHLSTDVVSTNYFDLKIKAWKSELNKIETEISEIQDVNWGNLLLKLFQNQNLHDLYKHLNQISAEVSYQLDHQISVIFRKSDENYIFYFAEMQEILNRVKIAIQKLYKKDVKVFLFNWKIDSMLL